MFYCGPTAHAQYICSTPEGRQEGMLALLFDYLISELRDKTAVKYLDFGICTEDRGLVLNEGLEHQKRGLGGGGVVYDWYEIDVNG